MENFRVLPADNGFGLMHTGMLVPVGLAGGYRDRDSDSAAGGRTRPSYESLT